MFEKTLAGLAIKLAEKAGEDIEKIKQELKDEACKEIDELFALKKAKDFADKVPGVDEPE